jgi:hypothetical protein
MKHLNKFQQLYFCLINDIYSKFNKKQIYIKKDLLKINIFKMSCNKLLKLKNKQITKTVLFSLDISLRIELPLQFVIYVQYDKFTKYLINVINRKQIRFIKLKKILKF